MILKKATALVSLTLLAVPALAHPLSRLHWIKIHVYHAKPSQVFQRLGLTHTTRYGNTLGQRDIPDPTFPPGLTDVVPYNPTDTLLVHGTTAGVAAFCRRVEAADIAVPGWPLTVTLSQSGPNSGEEPLAVQNVQAVDDQPLIVTFSTDNGPRQYELTLHDNSDGTLTLTRRTALSLASVSSASASGLFVPAQIWTHGVTQDIAVGQPFTFNDLAADREAARAQIGQPEQVESGDFQIQVQIVPPAVVNSVGAAEASLP